MPDIPLGLTLMYRSAVAVVNGVHYCRKPRPDPSNPCCRAILDPAAETTSRTDGPTGQQKTFVLIARFKIAHRQPRECDLMRVTLHVYTYTTPATASPVLVDCTVLFRQHRQENP